MHVLYCPFAFIRFQGEEVGSGLTAIWRAEYRSLRNRFRAMRALDYVKVLFLALIAAGFIVAEVLFFHRVFAAIREQQEFGAFFALHLVERLLAMVFLASLSMLFFSNIVNSLSTLFLSADMELLLASPIKPRTIFLSRFLETVGNSSLMILAFLTPILFSYGYAFDADASYYLLVVITILLFILSPAGFGVALTMVLVRFFQARRVHRILTFTGLVFAVTLVVVLRLLRPERLFNPSPTDDVFGLLQGVTLPTWGYLPSTWAMRSAIAAMNIGPEWKAYSWNIGLLALAAAVSVAASAAVAEKLFVTGWLRSREAPPAEGRAKRLRLEPCLRRLFRRLRPDSRAIITKDIVVFLRDPSQWSQLFLLAALAAIYLFNIKFLPKNPLLLTATITIRNFISWINLGMAGFVLSAIALRFTFPSVSQEGQAFWCIACSPLRYRKYLWRKFFLYGIPLLVLAELLTFFSNRLLAVDLYVVIVSLITVFFFSAALTGLGVGLGAAYPRFRLKNPARIALSSGGILFMILSLIYVGAVVGLEVVPVYHYFMWKSFGAEFPATRDALYYLGAIVLSLLATLLPMFLGERVLTRLEK
jgi:ABC-2 type transport system permease protein